MAKKQKKFTITFITSDEYSREGRHRSFRVEGDSLEALLLLADRHTSCDRKRIPWAYIGVYKNYNPKTNEYAKQLLFIALKSY